MSGVLPPLMVTGGIYQPTANHARHEIGTHAELRTAMPSPGDPPTESGTPG